MKATDKELGILHKRLAKSMLDALEASDTAIDLLNKDYDTDLPDEIVDYLSKQARANPALLTAVSKFLKDNDITCQIEDNNELSDLEARLKDKQRKRVGNVVNLTTE